MPTSKFTYDLDTDVPSPVLREDGIESGFIGVIHDLKLHKKGLMRQLFPPPEEE